MAGGPWSGFVSASYLGSDGDFPFEDDNGTPENPSDDERTDRRNNDFDSYESLAKVQYALDDDATISGVQEVFQNDQGVPGIGAFQSEHANLRELRSLTYLRYRDEQVGTQPLALTGTGFFVFEQQEFRDLQGEIGLGNQATDNRTYVGGGGLEAEYLQGVHELVGRLDLTGEVFSPKDELAKAPNGPNQARITMNAAVGDTFGLFGDRLLVQPSFRYEFVHDDFGGTIGPGGLVAPAASGGSEHLFTPRLGLSFAATSWLTLKGNAGRYARVPNFTELFGNRGSIVGNPGLDPEQGVNADIGWVAESGRLGMLQRPRLEVVGFLSDVDDLIVLVQNSQRTSVPRNVGSARVYGTEIAGHARVWDRFGLVANYTYQDAIDESGIPGRDGNQLPGRPQHEVYTRASVDIVESVGVFYELSFIAGNFLDQANFREVSSRTIHTVGTRLDVPRTPFTLTFEARNLGDNQIEDVAGFPLPGRSFFGSLAWRWAARGEEGA
jgi:iron complex outermembrane receptor protein